MGGTALDILARDIQAALDNDEVHAILLDVDSPGGVAVSPSEMADVIRRASENQTDAYNQICSGQYRL